jgi:hypothetical protein
MQYRDLDHFVKTGRAVLGDGPVAIVLAEDDVEIAATLAHHRKLGFHCLVLLHAPWLALPEGLEDVHCIPTDPHNDAALAGPVNRLIQAAPARTWMFACYNAEFLHFPFCESRTVGEMLAFHAEERRDGMLTYLIDLYAADLAADPNAVSLHSAHFDATGYYALERQAASGPKERQFDFFGGLRWRFEEHVPKHRRRIDRISLFRTRRGLRFLPDFTLSDEEYNTCACPWHHNLTAAVCSFRAAKALKCNPGSRDTIQSFHWHNSVPFEWSSQQLMDLGLMEPGQWF